KYKAVAGGRPLLYGADTLAGHRVAVLTEGEFDCMLLEQEAGGLVGVATLGGCKNPLRPDAMLHLLHLGHILLALDADPEGQAGAAKLAALSARARPMPMPC